MMRYLLGFGVGSAGVAGVLALFLLGRISEATAVGLVVLFVMTGLVIAAIDRVQEVAFALTGFKIQLADAKREAAEAKEQVASLEQRLARMYGDLGPQVWRAPDKAAMGLPGNGMVGSHAVINYVSGCVRRERVRLASVFIGDDKRGEELARAIADMSVDDRVFAWTPGPEPFLRNPIRPATQEPLS